MNTRFLLLMLALVTIGAFGCRKDEMQPADCSKLQKAIFAGNPDEVETEINRISGSLTNTPDSQEGLEAFAAKIASQCNVTAVQLCYNCIQTLPAQSEIQISITSIDLQKDKIIDIVRSGDKFVFAGMHD